MRVELDQERCSGHAQCHAAGPDVYDLDDYGYSVLNHTEIPTELVAQARAGATACPERAIQIIEN